MGRWGLRRIAMLCVLVWITAACAAVIPAPTLVPPPAFEATLILRTDLPPAATAPRSPRATATRSNATIPAPPPQHTPVPIPSPQFYTVMEGDTAASIAAQFAIPLPDLLTANDHLSPHMIYPGQMLLIPAESSAIATETLVRLLPTHTPLPLELPDVVCQHTPADEILCVGWVQNPYDAPVSGLTVGVTLVNDVGEYVVQRGTTMSQQVLRSGDGAPYMVRFPDAPAYTSVSVEVLSAEWHTGEAQVIALTGQGVVIHETIQAEDADLVRVRGSVQGDPAAAVQNVVIVLTLFDAEGQVTGYRVLRPDAPLAAGEALTLDVLLLPLLPGTSHVVVYAEGVPVNMGDAE